MPVDPVLKYLSDVEVSFSNLESGYIERYEEEILTPERVNLRIRVRFPNGCMLEWNEAFKAERENITHLGYRYHFQDKDNKLIFRYDNTPHFPHLDTYPHHKHLSNSVIAVNRPTVFEVINEVNGFLAGR